ncbi:hypothetical protein AOQ84DRAFT_433029 [Glonium stellatum]|uniref:Uncharacterized protein n=1 Tax=Glonium stellatum TaxID=574774 RepID=A0A8E2JQ75_9PEZI|nr:hypothetical protein AOQ84DRAFT_433029 [Glonium stellatum]
MSRAVVPIYNALIRTHHITSRKKVASLKKAADKYACYVLLRSGGSPGIMYCEGSEDSVRDWVTIVQQLRYKDYRLAARPNELGSKAGEVASRPDSRGFQEVTTVKEFGVKMQEFGIWTWWRIAMGYGP